MIPVASWFARLKRRLIRAILTAAIGQGLSAIH
jgi:hypothetical protein